MAGSIKSVSLCILVVLMSLNFETSRTVKLPNPYPTIPPSSTSTMSLLNQRYSMTDCTTHSIYVFFQSKMNQLFLTCQRLRQLIYFCFDVLKIIWKPGRECCPCVRKGFSHQQYTLC